MKHLLSALSALLLATLTPGVATAGESTDARDARLHWWREAKFGLFIHWGVYAVPAGSHAGTPVEGNGEWIMLRGKIPVADYRAYATRFNPVKYDPAAWAALAREAGMKYIVITAKHHDGFALFPSDVTDWDIADATPYHQDLISPLAEAARKNGLKFGTYYSQAQDWTHPGGAKSRYKEGESWDEANKGDFDAYLAKIAGPQVREILTRIQPDILWWDTPIWMNADRAKSLHDLIALRPGLITNNRLGGGFTGDTETPEQHVPATGFKDRDWETCMTMNGTWGYKSDDDKWKPTATLLRNLIDIVSKGGNYLLNVGPTAEGEIPAASIQRLKEVGAWMKVNGTAIYGTTASPFSKLLWGRCTTKLAPGGAGGTLYLHVFDWPAAGKLVLPGLLSPVTSARLLATGEKVGVSAAGGDVTLALPANPTDPVASVIEVAFTGALQVDRRLPGPLADGRIELGAEVADIHNTLRAHAELAGKGADARITRWDNAQSRVSWEFHATQAGTFTVQARLAGPGGGKLALLLDQKSVATVEVPAAASAGPRLVELGRITIPAAGDYTLELKPDRSGWQGFELSGITLQPGP